jgi:hypothetical protein
MRLGYKESYNDLIIVWQGSSWSVIAADGTVLARFPDKYLARDFARSYGNDSRDTPDLSMTANPYKPVFDNYRPGVVNDKWLARGIQLVQSIDIDEKWWERGIRLIQYLVVLPAAIISALYFIFYFLFGGGYLFYKWITGEWPEDFYLTILWILFFYEAFAFSLWLLHLDPDDLVMFYLPSEHKKSFFVYHAIIPMAVVAFFIGSGSVIGGVPWFLYSWVSDGWENARSVLFWDIGLFSLSIAVLVFSCRYIEDA